MPSTDLVIKSYPSDYGWLSYCLRSIQKFATGFNNIILLLPRSAPLTLTAETVVLLDTPESYMHQQIAKLNADNHTRADYIVHFDSDMIFTKPVTPEFWFKDGKPTWIHSPFEKDSEMWKGVMQKCIGQEPPAEFMRRGAIIIPRQLYSLFRAFIQEKHQQTMEQYILSQPGNEFSEYNCIGFYAWLYHHDLFSWHDTAIDGVPEWPFKQFWSWGGMTPVIREEMESILA